MKRVCVKDCIWQRRRWRKGETYSGADQPPKWFQAEEDARLEPEKGDALQGPMTLAQAQERIGGASKGGDLNAARSLAEASDLMFK